MKRFRKEKKTCIFVCDPNSNIFRHLRYAVWGKMVKQCAAFQTCHLIFQKNTIQWLRTEKNLLKASDLQPVHSWAESLLTARFFQCKH